MTAFWEKRTEKVRRPFLLSSLLFLVIIATQAFAGTAAAQGSQIIINDINNELSSTQKAALIKLVEKQIVFHRAHAYFKTPVVLKIRLFSSDQDYIAYFRNTLKGKGPMSPTGYFAHKTHELIVNKTKRGYFRTLLHEAQHAIFRLTGAKAPKWLNEGLSSFFDQTYVENGTIFIKANKEKADKVKKYAERNELTPLRKLISLTDKEWKSQFEQKNFKYYAECWSLVYFMVVDRQARQRHDLIMILRDLRKGSKVTVAQAINQRYPGGVNALERDWRRFIGTTNFGQKIKYES
jgi:hypothetical protein